MKSLEIVNRKLLETYNDESFATGCTYIEDDELSIIKQDLEVLEILGYRAVDIGMLKEIIDDYNNNEEAMRVYNINVYGYRKLLFDEFLKLKNWLEVNEE